MDEKIIIDTIGKQLTDAYSRANSYSKKRDLSFELEIFSDLRKQIIGNLHNLDCLKDPAFFKISQKAYSLYIKTFERIRANNDFYFELSKSIIDLFINYNFSEHYYKQYIGDSRRVNNKIIKNAMIEFINCYGIYKNDFDLLITSEIHERGEFYPFGHINKNLIVLNPIHYDYIEQCETLIHELGHLFQFKIFYDVNNLSITDKIINSEYAEVSSEFFRYSFYNFLKENKIYSTYVFQKIAEFLMELLWWMFELNLICYPDIEYQINPDGYIDLNDKKILDYGNEMANKLNCHHIYQLLSSKKINVEDAVIYGLGNLFAIHLYENSKENPNFLKKFKNSLLTYPYLEDIGAFEIVGITKKSLLKGDVLTKVLKQYCQDPKK